ncbi:hypothetical protein D3C87_1488870 [compost metagenome]
MAAPQQVTEQVLGVAALRWRWCGCQAQLAAGLARGQGILAALERQRRAVAVIEGEDFTDKNHVVAAFILEGGAALKTCRAVLQQRRPADAMVQLDLRKLVLALGGETSRQSFLFGGQHVDVPVFAAGEDWQAAGLLGQAPEHHRRIERHRVETVGRDTHG